MKILFVGDPHLDSRTPIARADDYAEVSLTKLEFIKTLCIDNNIKIVILTGDTFDKDNYDQPLSYINKVIAKFKEFYDSGITIYSLIGNHDLRHNKMEYFTQSPLHILFQTGFVKHLDKVEQDNFVLYGIDFTDKEKIDKINRELDTTKTNILTMHYATDNTIPYESIDRKDFERFDVVVSGHDHKYYEHELIENKPILLRPGSMIRRTKDKYNLERLPLVYLIELNDSSIVTAVESFYITDKQAESIFKSQVFSINTEYNSNNISALFIDQYFKRDALSLKEIITALPLPITMETKEKLLKYLAEQGL